MTWSFTVRKVEEPSSQDIGTKYIIKYNSAQATGWTKNVENFSRDTLGNKKKKAKRPLWLEATPKGLAEMLNVVFDYRCVLQADVLQGLASSRSRQTGVFMDTGLEKESAGKEFRTANNFTAETTHVERDCGLFLGIFSRGTLVICSLSLAVLLLVLRLLTFDKSM